VYLWIGCGCCADINNYDYCSECYNTKKEHIDSLNDNNELYYGKDGFLYNESHYWCYSLNDDVHYTELVDNMNKLKPYINSEIITRYDNIDQTDKILDAYSGVFNDIDNYISNNMKFVNDDEKEKILGIIARYSLGYQIEYCLRTTGKCNVNCEY
jgi:hypothetical protein